MEPDDARPDLRARRHLRRPGATTASKIGFHTGKAVGLDVTVQIKPWLGVRVGLPFYIDPLAVSLTLGAPMKWQFAGGKYAIGVLDDFLTIKLYRFAPSFYQEFNNAVAANGTSEMGDNTIQSRGDVRLSGYGIYQHQPKLAFIGRVGVIIDDFKTTSSTSSSVELGGLRTFIRAGLEYTVRSYLDLGFSIGFDDLGHGGTFGPGRPARLPDLRAALRLPRFRAAAAAPRAAAAAPRAPLLLLLPLRRTPADAAAPCAAAAALCAAATAAAPRAAADAAAAPRADADAAAPCADAAAPCADAVHRSLRQGRVPRDHLELAKPDGADRLS